MGLGRDLHLARCAGEKKQGKHAKNLVLENTCLHLAKVRVRNVTPKLGDQFIRSTGCLHSVPSLGAPFSVPAPCFRPGTSPSQTSLGLTRGPRLTSSVFSTHGAHLSLGTPSILSGSLPGMIIPPELGLTHIFFP